MNSVQFPSSVVNSPSVTLPLEMWDHLFSFLDVKSLASVSCVQKLFYDRVKEKLSEFWEKSLRDRKDKYVVNWLYQNFKYQNFKYREEPKSSYALKVEFVRYIQEQFNECVINFPLPQLPLIDCYISPGDILKQLKQYVNWCGQYGKLKEYLKIIKADVEALNTFLKKWSVFRELDKLSEIIELFIKAGAKPSSETLCIFLDLKKGSYYTGRNNFEEKIINLLLKAGAEPNYHTFEICNGRDVYIKKFLLIVNPDLIFLNIALSNKMVDIVKKFLDSGVKPNIKSLNIALSKNMEEIAKKFLEAGVKPNTESLEIASFPSNCTLEMMRLLLEKGAVPSIRCLNNFRVWQNEKMAILLLEANVKPDADTLNFAVEYSDLKMLTLLLSKGAKPNTEILKKLRDKKMLYSSVVASILKIRFILIGSYLWMVILDFLSIFAKIICRNLS